MLPDTLDAVVRALASPVAGAIFLNQLDEAFIDASWFVRGLHRRARRHLPLQALRKAEPRRVAILVPAWKESAVIQAMLQHNLEAIDYDVDRYDFFCGTYRNDPETQACVDAVARVHRNVHKVVVPHDGPTSKADCLNWVYQGIVLEEQRRGRRFDILLLHDAEDVIHPLALRLYSRLIPPHHFVQTPVFSLELGVRQAVASTYIDEFSEHHLKEMRVREAIRGLVPSAGVGSAFDREAFEEIALAHGQKPFNPESLTEDYDIGLRFRLANKRVHFACNTVDVEQEGDEPGQVRRREEYIATREYFPGGFQASVRQRSRWILGITLQAAHQIGWQGPLPVRYCLWRDRKGLLNNVLILLAYAILLYACGRSVVAGLTGRPWSVANIAPPSSVLAALLCVNALTLAWRGTMKAVLVARLYGWLHGVLSLPRMLLANLISLCATARAVRMWVRHRRTGEPLRWLKTAHVFPSVEALQARRRLGEILVERSELGEDELESALDLQWIVDRPLGEVLTVAGLLPARSVMKGLAEQLEMPLSEVDPEAIPLELLRRLPEAESQALDVLPLGPAGGASVRLAVTDALAPEVLERLGAQLGAPVAPVLVDAAALLPARERAYRRLVEPVAERRRLGERLIAAGHASAECVRRALDEQRFTGELLGEVLVRSGSVNPAALSEALLPGHGGFLLVKPEDADPVAVARLGYGFCALHGLVPLKPAGSRIRRIAIHWPLHPETEAAMATRLGEPVAPVAAPGLHIRAALALAARQVGAQGGVDRAEAQALFEAKHCDDPSRLLELARRAGSSPIDYLVARGHMARGAAATTRATVLGIGQVALVTRSDERFPGLVPPRLAGRHAIEVIESAERCAVLAAPRPTAELYQELARALPGWRIAWRVSAAHLPAERGGEVSSAEAA